MTTAQPRASICAPAVPVRHKAVNVYPPAVSLEDLWGIDRHVCLTAEAEAYIYSTGISASSNNQQILLPCHVDQRRRADEPLVLLL